MFKKMVAAGALLALALSACTKVGESGGVSSAGSNPWTQPGRLVVSTSSDPKALDPVVDAAQPTLELSMFLFSYAIRYDDHAKPVPDALSEVPTPENGDVSKDGLTLRYKLRHGIVWHDGKGELTCTDLRFTWQVVMNPKNNVVTTDGYKDIRDIDCRDPYVAVVHMKRVYAPYLQQLWGPNGNAPILPEHVLAKYNDANGSFNTAPFQSAPIGSGPYKFVSWTRGSDVRMEVNPKFYLGTPAIHEVVYRILPDANTLVTQLKTHEIDLAFNLPAPSWDQIRALPGTVSISPTVYAFAHLDFNLRRPIFADVRVRRALAYAIDRKTLLEKVQHGLGELTDTFLTPSLYPEAYDKNVMKYPYDPAAAQKLLDQAGWRAGSDGIRVKNGQRLAFNLSTQTESTTGHAIQQQVIAWWHAIGADVQVKNYPTSIFFENSASGVLQGGKYDMAFFVWGAAADIDQSAIYSAHNMAPHGQNALFWNNAVATKAMDDANATVDMKRRIADYQIVQSEFAKDVPSVILWFRKEPIAWNSDLRGITATAVLTPPFWNTWAYKI